MAQGSVEQINSTNTSLDSISQQVNVVSNMAHQIAAAAAQQSTVAEDISKTVVQLDDSANYVGEQADNTNMYAARMKALSDDLKSLVASFKL